MVCDKVVCVKEGAEEEEEEEEAGRRRDGYRIKNKNPAQRCGEKCGGAMN